MKGWVRSSSPPAPGSKDPAPAHGDGTSLIEAADYVDLDLPKQVPGLGIVGPHQEVLVASTVRAVPYSKDPAPAHGDGTSLIVAPG